MQVTVVVPVLSSPELVGKCQLEYRNAAAPDTEVSFVPLDIGTTTIESFYDMALAQPDTIRKAMDAEKAGADAVIIACFGDPGGAGAKEALTIPVTGEGEAALYVVSLLARRFSIITVRRQTIPFMAMMTESVGLGHKLVSVRAVEHSVMDFSLDAVDEVVSQTRLAIKEDGAEGIVMGCTGTGVDMAAVVSERIEAEFGYVPIVDPVKAAIGTAETLVRSGYRPSKLTYPMPFSMRPEYPWYGEQEGPVPKP
jgi:allantoin racemase